MMKRLVLIFLLTLTCQPFLLTAEPEIGLIIGSPTGLNVEYNRFQAAAGWDVDKMFHFHLDYLFFKNGTGAFEFYFGGGGVYVSQDSANKNSNNNKIFGPRAPLGMTYLIKDVSLKVFLEVAPTLFILEKLDFDLQWGLGVRYVF